MKYSCTYLPYKQTNFFSNLVVDYLQQNEYLKAFQQHTPNLNGIKNAIQNREQFATNRNALTNYFNEIYTPQNTTLKQKENIELLKKENCFTITTAHQPNIFTGPLYFIYKILHAIKLADDLNKNLPNHKFVPVYYMGSEDADIEELGNITLQQKKITWNTKQTGAVGRMKVDENFIKLIDEIESQIAVNEFGNELMHIFRECYKINTSIQHSTFNVVNTLFSDYGLLVLNPDNYLLKKTFTSTIEKELRESFSEKEVEQTVAALNKNYKTKATGRAINIFYLIDDKRERIEQKNGLFIVEKLGLQFTIDEIIIELNNYPDRFSPNVILRPVFQETILPNVAFIGGGGEIAYWLQLKNVFAKAGVPLPPILLRNSFLLYQKMQENKLQKMNLAIQNLFMPLDDLFNHFVKTNSTSNSSLQDKIASITTIYNSISLQATTIDATLHTHTQALATKALKQILSLEKKMLRAEKRKFIDQKNQLTTIKTTLFFNNNLQERTDNFSYLYSIYGKDFFNIILQCSNSFEQQFGLVCIEN